MAQSGLDVYMNETISVITNDGRNIVVRATAPREGVEIQKRESLMGVLRGFDQTTNIVLTDSHERVFSIDAPMEQEMLGLYVIRGDNIAVIGAVDQVMDQQLDLDAVRAEPIKSVVH